MTDRLSYHEVRAAAERVITDLGMSSLDEIRHQAAILLPVHAYDQRFRGQVYRALEEMWREGKLHKIRAPRTGGLGAARRPVYETPEHKRQREDEKAETEQIAARLEARRASVKTRLAAHGITAVSPPGKDIRLSLEGWEMIMDALGEPGEQVVSESWPA